MSLPSTGKSTLAKLASVFAIGFVISLGLCGANFVAMMSDAFREVNGTGILMVTGYLELAGMAICGIGILFVGLMALSDAVSRRFAARQNPPEDKP